MGKENNLNGEATEKSKAYALVDAENIKILRAYKCPTKPTTYIHVDFIDKEDGQLIFKMIHKSKSSHPVFGPIMFQLHLVVDIVEGRLHVIAQI